MIHLSSRLLVIGHTQCPFSFLKVIALIHNLEEFLFVEEARNNTR